MQRATTLKNATRKGASQEDSGLRPVHRISTGGKGKSGAGGRSGGSKRFGLIF